MLPVFPTRVIVFPGLLASVGKTVGFGITPAGTSTEILQNASCPSIVFLTLKLVPFVKLYSAEKVLPDVKFTLSFGARISATAR